MVDKKFWQSQRVFLTGHTGFKGSWLVEILKFLGTKAIAGYALAPDTNPNLFSLANIENGITSIIGDIRNYDKLKVAFDSFKPTVVIHLAAQPLVRDSFDNPKYTYDVNVMGTVNILECVRHSTTVKSFLNVTTDKVYLNREWEWGYREVDELNGYDPYSNSKSCSELVTHSYKNSFFNATNIAVSTARAGNVIGGGDFSKDRIIPDCMRAAIDKKPIVLRNPNSTRPYQHVLEPLFAYLLLLEKQYANIKEQGYYNVGPNDNDCVSTGTLVELFAKHCSGKFSSKIETPKNAPHEANFLKLDCSKFKNTFNWQPKWNIDTAVSKTVEWIENYTNKKNISQIMQQQIKEYYE